MVSGSEDRIARNVLTPVVKGHPPRVGACMRTERSQSVKFRFPCEPSAVLLSDGSVRSLNLGMVKDGFPKDEVTIRGPGKVVKSMVRVLATEPGQDGFPVVRLAVAIGVFEEAHMGFFGDIYSSVSKLK